MGGGSRFVMSRSVELGGEVSGPVEDAHDLYVVPGGVVEIVAAASDVRRFRALVTRPLCRPLVALGDDRFNVQRGEFPTIRRFDPDRDVFAE